MKLSGQLHALVALLPWKEALVPSEWDGGGPKADLDALEKRKYFPLPMTEP
jgi:hypothetical protein